MGSQTERFDALFREHYDAVSAYARRRGDDDRAQDAVAETFLVAWRRIDDVPEDALPWLLGVTRKVLANQRRSDGRGAALAQRLAEVATGASADDPADVVARAELMRAAFERLSERDRATLLEAAGWPGASVRAPGAEAVQGTGATEGSGAGHAGNVSPNALAVRLHRARGRLQAQVEALGALPLLLIAIAVGCALLLTPPGRAGMSWALELIGVGDVGGSPTKADRDPWRPTASPLVVDNGRAPDGSRYEWVAHRGGLPAMRTQDATGWRPGDPPPDGPVRRIPASTGLCLFFEWPDHPGRRGQNGCWPRPHPSPPVALQSRGPIQSFGWWPVQARFKDFARPDAVVTGSTSGAVDRVEIVYADSGGRHRLPVDFARVDGALLRRLGLPPGRPGPFGVFTAFVGGRLAARDRLTDRYPQGEILVDRRLRTGFPATDACLRRHGRPPVGSFELRAYGIDGRLLDVRRTLVGNDLPRGCLARWYEERPR